MSYLWAFAVAFGISVCLTPVAKRLGTLLGAVDRPDDARRFHRGNIPRLGGLALFVAFIIPVLIYLPLNRSLSAFLVGVTLLFAIGLIDDLRGLSPWVRLAWQVMAALIVLAGGIGITSLTNPFGGNIDLNIWRFAVDFGRLHFHISPIANLLSVIWMVGLVNTINFLDGLDGLAAGVSAIAAVIMFLLAIGPRLNQPAVALIAIVVAGSALGFLPFNFYPARIFMGDSGSYFLGLTLALVAIYSGAKLATASLVLGFTIIDGIWTVARRLYRRSSPFTPDRRHLHFLMVDYGWSQQRAVLILYLLALGFGGVALISGSFAKLVALIILAALMSVLIGVLVFLMARKQAIAGKTKP